MVPGQHGASQVVEAGRTRFAPVTLAMRLRIVASVPDDRRTVAGGAAHALWPAMLAHKGEALGVVHQAGKVDQVGCGYDTSSSCEQATYSRFCSYTRGPQPRFPVLASPPRNPIRANLNRKCCEIRICLPAWGIFHPRRVVISVSNLYLNAICRTFEAAGVEFISENGVGAGVRLRKPAGAE